MSVYAVWHLGKLNIVGFVLWKGAKMMYFLDKSRQEKAIAVATRLDKNMRDKNVKVKDTVYKPPNVQWDLK